MPCVGVPKTMDNDVHGTDQCFGFDSSVTLAVRAGAEQVWGDFPPHAAAFLGGWMFLPLLTLQLQGIPDISKVSATSATRRTGSRPPSR